MERHHNGNAVKQAFYAVPSLDVLLLCVEGMKSRFRGTRMKFDCYVDSHGDLEESEVSDSNNELDLEEMDVVQLPNGLDAVLWESPQDEAGSFGDGSMCQLIKICSVQRHTWWMTKLILMMRMLLIHYQNYPLHFI
jgi:hypothetical protein